MEHGNTLNRVNPYAFLEQEDVQRYFATLNLALLSGRHVQRLDTDIFHLLSDYLDEFRYYYKFLYGLHIEKNVLDDVVYYYLDFLEGHKGKMSERIRQLTHNETIIGIMLLNMYYDRYFDVSKDIYWSDIENEIVESENSEQYEKLLFGGVRSSYTDNEWSQKAKKRFKDAIKIFDKLGWVERKSHIHSEDIHFSISPSINRLAKLYKSELEHFDAFVESYRHQE